MDGHRASCRCGCEGAAGGAARTPGRDELRLRAHTRPPPCRRLRHVEIGAQHRRTKRPPTGCGVPPRGGPEPEPPYPAAAAGPSGRAALPLPPPADGHRLRSAPSPGSGRRAARSPSPFPSAAPPAWPSGGEGGLGSGCGSVQRPRVFRQQGRAPRRRVAGSSLLFVLL